MKISAMRKPMPEPPPVMNATWPLGGQRDSQSQAPGTAPGRGGPLSARRPQAGEAAPSRPRPFTRRAGTLGAPALTPGCRG